MTLPDPLVDIWNRSKSQLRESFADHLTVNPVAEQQLQLAMEYAVLNGGKRLRPLL